MSYTIDLVRLSPGLDAEVAYKKQSKETEERLSKGGEVNPGPVDPTKEQTKEQLARALAARHPSLRIAQKDFAELAKAHQIDIPEAKRRFRDIELNEEQHSIQIALFDDTAGASFSFSGPSDACKEAMRMLWDCLEVLHSEGGFSAFDTQVGKVLDLSSDFDRVVNTACGRRVEGR